MKQKEYDRLINLLAQLKSKQVKYTTILEWKPSYLNDERESKYERALDLTNSEICKIMNELDNCINDSEADSFIPHFE